MTGLGQIGVRRAVPRHSGHLTGKRRGFPRRLACISCCRDQRRSWSTLCCDWLASASAETAIDGRVDSAWLLAASWFGSASVRLDDTNEEAANSQALSTRQSIAVSALALANSSQQSVLQLLR